MSGLDLARIRAAFPRRGIQHYRSVPSTMDVAAEMAIGSVVLADEQTAGQGRHGLLGLLREGVQRHRR